MLVQVQIKTAHKNCIAEDDRLNIGRIILHNAARVSWLVWGTLMAGPVQRYYCHTPPSKSRGRGAQNC